MLGETELSRIKQSLSCFFDNISEEPRVKACDPYPLLSIYDINQPSIMIIFYVIGKKYDVYRLAFKGFQETK